jgi:hypothetical protein
MSDIQDRIGRCYQSRSCRWLVLGLLGLIVAGEGYIAIFLRQNDFVCHRNVGTAFLQGDPYGNGNEIYPVGRALMNALLAIGPYHLTRAVCYVLAIMALGVCYRLWRRLAHFSGTVTPAVDAAAGLGTVLLTFPFLLRDLDECGMQIFLLFFLTVAGYGLARGRTCRAGFWLATAAVYKVTPVLCLPFLFWKRQWRTALWMSVFLAAWFLAPAVFLGLDMAWRSHAKWWTTSQHIASAREAYPSQLQREEPKVYNLSLAAAVARYLETYPRGHPLYLDHPAFRQFGDLDPLTAYYIVRGALLAVGLVVAWRCRRRWTTQDGGNDIACEWAAVCALCAIASPVCWKQHLIVITPAMFLALRSVLAGPTLLTWRTAALGIIGAVFLLSREFVTGKQLSLVLQSYKLDTYAILLLLVVVLTSPRQAANIARNCEIPPVARAA